MPTLTYHLTKVCRCFHLSHPFKLTKCATDDHPHQPSNEVDEQVLGDALVPAVDEVRVVPDSVVAVALDRVARRDGRDRGRSGRHGGVRAFQTQFVLLVNGHSISCKKKCRLCQLVSRPQYAPKLKPTTCRRHASSYATRRHNLRHMVASLNLWALQSGVCKRNPDLPGDTQQFTF